jgi:hypothetical protein
MRRTQIWLLAAGIAWAPAFASADWYRWESENGTVSFTDDAKRVPARHRESAERITARELESYARFTRVERHAGASPWQLGPDAAAADAAPAQEPKLHIPIGRGMLELPDDGSDEPIVVRRGRYAWTGDGYLKSHTIVERDGRVLAVIEDAR